jgi:hypothetical protein
MMSLEKNKAIARRYQDEVWGKGDPFTSRFFRKGEG